MKPESQHARYLRLKDEDHRKAIEMWIKKHPAGTWDHSEEVRNYNLTWAAIYDRDILDRIFRGIGE
jgi:hypothetical protein